jgi:RimJ/RimL family protein N-acetyltransferase
LGGQEHAINRFLVSISPDNEPSLALAEKMGFQRIGEQMDPEDGLEYVFELNYAPEGER